MTMKKSRIVTRTIHGETLTAPLRFFDKIDFTDTCWLWTGANSGSDRPYGITWDGERRVKAHRFAYETAGFAIPDAHQLDHLCKTTLCVRPSHLEPVTAGENIRRGDAPGPLAVRTNRCKRNHEFTPENTAPRKDGGRDCLACRRIHAAAYSARRTAVRKELTHV